MADHTTSIATSFHQCLPSSVRLAQLISLCRELLPFRTPIRLLIHLLLTSGFAFVIPIGTQTVEKTSLCLVWEDAHPEISGSLESAQEIVLAGVYETVVSYSPFSPAIAPAVTCVRFRRRTALQSSGIGGARRQFAAYHYKNIELIFGQLLVIHCSSRANYPCCRQHSRRAKDKHYYSA